MRENATMSQPSTTSSSAEIATARSEPLADDVDRDVLAFLQSIRRGEHHADDEQVTDELVDPCDRLVQQIAHDHRPGDQRERNEQRGGGERDADAREAADERLEDRHAVMPRFYGSCQARTSLSGSNVVP